MKSKILFVIILSVFTPVSLNAGGRTLPVSSFLQPNLLKTDNTSVVDVSLFYDQLTPYGNWFELSGYGWVWSPHNVAPGWRPYTVGRWAFTDDGWTWVSDEEWGWATYHYGRWLFDSTYGWAWVPGNVWGPAWVDWRSGEGWIGWAPLPPQVGWSVGLGLSFGNYDIPSFGYCFVEERRFSDRNVGRYIVLPARNVTLAGLTKRVTDYSFVDGHIFDRSIPVDRIEKVTGRPVHRYHIADIDQKASRRAQIKGDRVEVFRPAIADSTSTRVPPGAEHAARAASLDDMLKRHDAERRKMDDHQTAERTQLERIHRKEINDSHSKMPSEELKNRQDQERRAFDEQTQRERQIMENRHDRERSLEAHPASPMHEGHRSSPRPGKVR